MAEALESIVAKLRAGGRPSDADVQFLQSTSDIITLGMLAEDVRRSRHGDRVTFLRVARVAVRDAAGTGPFPAEAGEVRLDGPVASIDEAVGAARVVVARAGPTPVSAFSMDQLAEVATASGLPLDVGLARVKEAGLTSVARMALDGTLDVTRALEAAARAGLAVARVGFEHPGDGWLPQVRTLLSALEALSAVRVLAPLPRRLDPAAPTTGYEDLKRVALARLLAGPIDTIQVDWARYGPKLAQVSLAFGADDLDAVPAADPAATAPRRTTLEELRRNVRAAGFTPVERDGRWERKQ